MKFQAAVYQFSESGQSLTAPLRNVLEFAKACDQPDGSTNCNCDLPARPSKQKALAASAASTELRLGGLMRIEQLKPYIFSKKQ